jgi:molybdate transport system substrate-binding protein
MEAATRIRAMTLLAFVGAAGVADAAEIRVYCTGAPSQAVRTIAADFSAQTGHHLTFIVGQPATIESDLAAGDKADVVILPEPVIAMLKKSRKLRADSTADLAQVGIGVAVRAGAPQPDLSNAAAIRKLLLGARSIVYPDPQSGGGSAGRAIARMIDAMGVAETVKSKLTLTSAIGGGVELVARGKAEVGLFNISEILPIAGATLAGPLPAELQSYIVFDAAIPAGVATPEPASAFIKALTAPAERHAWQKAGLEPLGAPR